MSDFTNGAHECFCDRKYKDANKLASCGDCPRDYIVGAWDARRKYIEEHSKMTDRYERIRAALAMGPTPGEWHWSDANPELERRSARRALMSQPQN